MMSEWPDRKLTEPTPDETRNGWTAETLTRYIADAEKSQSAVIGFDPKARPKAKPRVANSKYSPFRWRA